MTREDIDRFLSENKDIASSIKSIAEKYKLSVQKVSWQIYCVKAIIFLFISVQGCLKLQEL